MATKSEAELFQQFHSDFATDYSVWSDQRDKCNEEIRFAMIPGAQWEGWLDKAYTDRAKMELDQASEYLYRTFAQWVDNRTGVDYVPDDDAATDEDAELLDNLYRRDLRRKNGQLAIDNAIFEAMACGTGAWHVSTEYDDDEDPDNDDQSVCFEPITNAFSTVVWDAGAQRLDKSDAKRCVVLYPFTRPAFEEKYPGVPTVSAATPQTRAMFNWGTPDLVYVAVRYDVETVRERMNTWGNPLTGEMVRLNDKELADERAELVSAGFEELSSRLVTKRVVYRSKFSGGKIIEKRVRIAGKFIPVIPVYGYRAHVDGVEFCHGVIRKRMDPQRLLNMSASLMAEEAAYSFGEKPIFDPKQVENLGQHWAQNIHQKPYLLARALTDENGKIVQTGPIGTLSGSRLGQASQQLMAITSQFIQQGTGGAPQDTMDTQASGKAINAVLKRVDMNTRPIFANIAAAVMHSGCVYQSIAAEIYTNRQRGVTVINGKGEPVRVTLLEMRGRNGAIDYGNDVSRGKYQVTATVGPAYESVREETMSALKDILVGLAPNDPLRPVVLGKLIELMPAQGLDDLKDFVHKQLLLAGVAKPETEEDFAILQQQAQQAMTQDDQAQLAQAFALNQRAEAMKRMKEIQEIDANVLYKRAQAAEKWVGIGKTVQEQIPLISQQPGPVRLQ